MEKRISLDETSLKKIIKESIREVVSQTGDTNNGQSYGSQTFADRAKRAKDTVSSWVTTSKAAQEAQRIYWPNVYSWIRAFQGLAPQIEEYARAQENNMPINDGNGKSAVVYEQLVSWTGGLLKYLNNHPA